MRQLSSQVNPAKSINPVINSVPRLTASQAQRAVEQETPLQR